MGRTSLSKHNSGMLSRTALCVQEVIQKKAEKI
jgi:hypothetical protein